MDICVHGYCMHRHIFLSSCTKLLFTKCTPYRNIAVYQFTSLLHAQSATEPISRPLQPILIRIIVTRIVSYRANIAANTSLLHALSVIKPILRLLQPILAHIIVTCIVSY